ncbi:MAG: hybrid sensor histidine kinase/response regulator [Candidatus Dormibacteraeota bacterium]|nr:hybrid sensor histidine kinase/response regulator [Candidatus Dormibacteraeota bacterium]
MTETDQDPVRILMLDDEPANLVALQAVLEPLGEELVAVTSGEEALWQVAKNDFAVLLLDVRMEGMSGIEVASLLRRRPTTRSIPVVFLTAYPEAAESVREAYRLGAADFIFKPIDPTALRAKVSAFVELHRQQRRIRRLLVEAEAANRSKAAFLRMAAHELRSPLATALGYLSLLQEGTFQAPPPAWGKPLGVLNRKLVDLARMMDDVLEVSRLEADAVHPDPGPVDLVEAAVAAAKRAGPRLVERDARFTVDSRSTPVRAHADPKHVARILDQLLDNALTYSERESEVRLCAYEEGAEAIVDVIDFGVGIQPDLRDRVFEPFFRLDDPARPARPGTGLGLTIGAGLARCNGGRLTIARSGPGEGSCLRLALPLATPPPAMESPVVTEIPVPRPSAVPDSGATPG